MAVVVVAAVVDHLIMVGGFKGRLTGLPFVDFALQASVSRFTPQPTTHDPRSRRGHPVREQEQKASSYYAAHSSYFLRTQL
jgi:hypothetical protein